jgi:hypothetical protein
VALIADSSAAVSMRINGLKALLGRLSEDNRDLVMRAISAARASQEPALRAEGLSQLVKIDADLALSEAVALDESASVAERQAAVLLIATIGGERAEQELLARLQLLGKGELDEAVQFVAREPDRCPQRCPGRGRCCER